MYIKVIFTLSYEEGHPIYIDAVACFHKTLKTGKVRRYMIEQAKASLLFHLDKLFSPDIVNMMEFVGVERIPDRIAKKEGLECPEYPNARITIIWRHREEEFPHMFETIEDIRAYNKQ